MKVKVTSLCTQHCHKEAKALRMQIRRKLKSRETEGGHKESKLREPPHSRADLQKVLLLTFLRLGAQLFLGSHRLSR